MGGEGVPQDDVQARTYFEQVVANSDDNPTVSAKARNILGKIYYFGQGVSQDYARARTYFEQVVNDQHADLAAKESARIKLAELRRI